MGVTEKRDETLGELQSGTKKSVVISHHLLFFLLSASGEYFFQVTQQSIYYKNPASKVILGEQTEAKRWVLGESSWHQVSS